MQNIIMYYMTSLLLCFLWLCIACFILYMCVYNVYISLFVAVTFNSRNIYVISMLTFYSVCVYVWEGSLLRCEDIGEEYF